MGGPTWNLGGGLTYPCHGTACRPTIFWTSEIPWCVDKCITKGQGRNQLFLSGGGQFSWNFIQWRHRAYSTVVQLFRKRSHIIIMYFCPKTRSPWYKHTHSAQRWLIKSDRTERFTTALEAESPVLNVISDFTPYAHAQSNIQRIKYDAEKTDD